MALCLNMIVKNEAARIARCLGSVVDHIACAVVVDTGSSDGTPDLIREILTRKGVPYEIHHVPFVNFAQARNAALAAARLSKLDFTYLLLMDADMEMKVSVPPSLNPSGRCYEARQRAGSLVYTNCRFLNRYTAGEYVGVTHEYLDVPTDGIIEGVEFIDHADGANRANKYTRDAVLLEDALKLEPNNGRYWFYLGQTYRDAGEAAKSAAAYKRSVEIGGWDEQVWNAQLNYAHALKTLGDENGFVGESLKAYNMRPQRGEVLYDLACHFRQKGGAEHVSTLFSEAGLSLPIPNDRLFVSEYPYKVGFRQEFGITAFYDPRKRDHGAAVCDRLSLDPATPAGVREEAQRNQFWYLQRLCALAPSFASHYISFEAPDGYLKLNPSVVCTKHGTIVAVVRTVNYTISDTGHYLIRGGDGSITSDNPIHTRNFLVYLSRTFEVLSSREILPPDDMPEAAFPLVRGFEDMRLFVVNDEFWVNACVREVNPEGWCEQFVASLELDDTTVRLSDAFKVTPPTRAHEKNWMPFFPGKFVYRPGQLITCDGKLTGSPTPGLEHISGGSQAIEFHGDMLCVVHEARPHPQQPGKRYYQHRFMLLDYDGGVLELSQPFVLDDRQIEFVAGLARHPDGKLMISYGVGDRAAWIATIDDSDVLGLLQ